MTLSEFYRLYDISQYKVGVTGRLIKFKQTLLYVSGLLFLVFNRFPPYFQAGFRILRRVFFKYVTKIVFSCNRK